VYQVTLSLGQCKKASFPLFVSAVLIRAAGAISEKTAEVFNGYSDPINHLSLLGTSDRIWIETERPAFHKSGTDSVTVRIYPD